MPSFELQNNEAEQLPILLLGYFNDWQDFSSEVRKKYIEVKNNRSGIDPAGFSFVEVLIGKDEAYDLSQDERVIFIKEVGKVVYIIEKEKRDMKNHWGEEAKRAGLITDLEFTKDGLDFSGDGTALEKQLKEK